MNDKLPDLSSWKRVPQGATIPAGMRYGRITLDGSIHVVSRAYDTTPAVGIECFTETQLSPPSIAITLGDFVERAEYLVQSLSDNTEAPLAELVRDFLRFLKKSADRKRAKREWL